MLRRRALMAAEEEEPTPEEVGNAITGTTAKYYSAIPINMPAKTVVEIECSFNWSTAGLGSDYIIARLVGTNTHGKIGRGSSSQNLRYQTLDTSGTNKWCTVANWSNKTVTKITLEIANNRLTVYFSDGTSAVGSNGAGATPWVTRSKGFQMQLKSNLYFKRVKQTTDGVLVHDCVPRKLGSDVGMLDLVDNSFTAFTGGDARIVTI